LLHINGKFRIGKFLSEPVLNVNFRFRCRSRYESDRAVSVASCI
jgi:hypothetical protein